jgi:hypothetical protein
MNVDPALAAVQPRLSFQTRNVSAANKLGYDAAR